MSASKYDDTFTSVLFDKLEKSIRPFYQENRTFVLQWESFHSKKLTKYNRVKCELTTSKRINKKIIN